MYRFRRMLMLSRMMPWELCRSCFAACLAICSHGHAFHLVDAPVAPKAFVDFSAREFLVGSCSERHLESISFAGFIRAIVYLWLVVLYMVPLRCEMCSSRLQYMLV
jgi:hypothetical protein